MLTKLTGLSNLPLKFLFPGSVIPSVGRSRYASLDNRGEQSLKIYTLERGVRDSHKVLS
jgi:hypothetical protein